jgi:hypothetical protein
MKLVTTKLEFGKKKQVKLLATSCWHIGNPAVSQKCIGKFIEKAKKHQWIHHGDIIEGITPDDRRFEAESHSATIMKCMESASEYIKRASKTCVGLVLGNHEHTPSTKIGDISETMARWGEVPYLSAVAFLNWKCPKGKFTHFVCHGNGSANYRTGEPERRRINKKIKLRSILDSFEADLKGMGHMHQSISVSPCEEKKLCVVDGKLDRHPVQVRSGWAYAAPSMFKTYNEKVQQTNYGELKIFPANDIGWIEVIVNDNGTIDRILEVNESGDVVEETIKTIV